MSEMLPEQDVNESCIRNIGIWSVPEQLAIQDSKVAIAGVGGDGGSIAEELVMAGVGEIRVADPELFSRENLNRQAFSNVRTLRRNKAEVVAEGLRAINPDLTGAVYTEGITSENIESFLKDADLLIDETEFTMPWLGIMAAQAAREKGIPTLMAMNVGFAGTATTFAPKSNYTFERMLGLPTGVDPKQVEASIWDKKLEIPLKRWLPYVPPYTDLDVLRRVAEGSMPAPTVGIGVAMASGIAATQACLWLTRGVNSNRPDPIVAPRVRFMDAMTGESKDIRFPRFAPNVYVWRMIWNNVNHRVPKMS